jgi:O-antigen/teichoic acid export membrane protein
LLEHNLFNFETLKVFKSVSVFAAVSLITSGISFLLLPVLTKYLSKEDYGLLSIFTVSIRFLVLLISLGITSLLMTYIFEKDKLSLSSYFKTYYIIILFNCFIASFLIIIGFIFFDDFHEIPKKIAVLVPLIAAGVIFYELILSLMTHKQQIKKFAFTSLSKFVFEALMSLLFVIFFLYKWEGRIGALVLSLIFISFVGFSYLKKENLLKGKFDIKKLKEMVVLGSPLLVLEFSTAISAISDRFFIEHFLGLSQTGVYGVAFLVASIVLVSVSSLTNVFRPLIYNKIQNYPQDKKSLSLISLQHHISLLALTILIVCVLKKIIFAYFIDVKFSASEELVWPMACGFFFWGLNVFYLSYFIFEKESKIIFIVSIFHILSTVLLNYLFIPVYGLMGASYTPLITNFFGSIIVFVLFHFYLKPQLLVKYNLR